MPNSDEPSKNRQEKLAVTIEEGARLISISRRKMFDLLADGTIPSTLVGRRRRIRMEDLKTYLQRDDVA